MNKPVSKTRRALGLRAYLNLVLAVTIVIFIVANGWAYTRVESRLRADVEEHLGTLAAHSAGDTILNWLGQKRSLARALAGYPAMREMRVAEAQGIINATYDAAPADYNNIGFFDATGLMVADIAGGTGKGNLKSIAWGQEVYDGRRIQSPELISTQNNRPIFVLYERVMDASGTVVGVVGVGTDLTIISEHLEEMMIGQTGEAMLVNSQGMVLNRLRYKPDSILTLDLSGDRLAQLAVSGQTGVVEMADYRGVPVVAAYRPVPEYGWGVVVKQDASEAFGDLGRLRAISFGAIAGALVIALISNLLVQRRVNLALNQLIAGSRRFASGELAVPIEPQAIGEFDRLAGAFNAMAARVGELTGQLRATVEQLLTPAISLREGLLAMPLVGAIDTARARQITDTLLQEIVRQRARVVILDISGVPTVDTAVVKHLSETIAAARLLGVRVIVSGISPRVALTLVELGVTWGDVLTVHTMGQAMEAVGEAVRSKQ